MQLQQEALFVAGEGGYHTYRIPALAVSTEGTILAFCEGRKSGPGDAGDIDLLLRRSCDSGRTWEPPRVLADDGPHTVGNPAPVIDFRTGTICLLFCKNPGDGGETKIRQGQASRTVWITRSDDDGVTWSEPVEITKDAKRPSWTWYATGPGHGIQLAGGRLVIACDHTVGVSLSRATDPNHSHVIYSDDHGDTWHIGGIVPDGTNESTAVQVAGGALYINCRNWAGETRRAYAWSYDDGGTFGQFGRDDALVEPRCQASIVRFTSESTHGRNRILFANPASTARERMTVRLSYDECRSWTGGRALHAGPAAYSDLCIARDMTICCLYERGESHPYESITMARFSLRWLSDGADSLIG